MGTLSSNCKILFISIASTDIDFLLAPYVLKHYLYQFTEITDNYIIDIKDYGSSVEYNIILKDILDINPDMIFMSRYIWNTKKIDKLCENLSEFKIVIGGPHIDKDETNNNIINISGEGEGKIYSLLTGNNPEYLYIKNGCTYSYIDNKLLSKKEMRFNIETSRGCIYKCRYCKYHKNIKGIKYRPIESVISDFKYLQKYDNITDCMIIDSDFIVDVDRATEIIKELTNIGITFKISAEIIIDNVNDDFCNAVRSYIDNGGMFQFGIGIQSLNKKALSFARRHRNGEKERKNIAKLISTGCMLRLDIILGLPYETLDSYIDLIMYMCSIMKYDKSFINFNQLSVIPGTEFADIEYKLTKDELGIVIETEHISKNIMDKLKKINTILYRIFHPKDVDLGKYNIRHKFLSIDNKFSLLEKMSNMINMKLGNEPRDYYRRNVINDIPEKDMINMIDFIRGDNYIDNK